MSPDHAAVFPERGEVAALMRSTSWSETPLGTPETWSPSLRTVLRLMLTSRYAMWMGWGKDLAFFYNDAYRAQTLGAKHPWALGRSAREVWAEIWDAIGPRIDHVLRTGEATWDEGLLLFLERNGYPEETYHTFSYSPLPGEVANEIAGLFCVVIEETERVIGERRIALLRDFASQLSQAKTAEAVFSAAERCLTADSRDIPFSLTYLFEDDGRALRRVSATSFVEEHPRLPEWVGPEQRESWPFREAIDTAAPRLVELPSGLVWPTGAWAKAPSHAVVVPISQQGQSRPAGLFVAGTNPHRPFDESFSSFVALFVGQLAAGLSNARAHEDERKRADALAEIDRAKTAFFSNVSHEFRTPLTLMLGPTEDALGSPERALRGAELETVHRNELRLLKLVNALLDFARIEAGRIQASYHPTDLGALTTDLASSFRSAIERAGLEMNVDCEPFPEPVFVDHGMWEKIVLNLLSNALKFTFDGKIDVTLRWRDDHAELLVSDTGGGIAEHELPRIFERFHRIEGARARTHEGSGIGLALVHELVRLHGGTIHVTSEVDVGTTFTISIPRGRAHLPEERVAATQVLASTSVGTAYVEEALRWGPDEPAQHSDSTEPGATTNARILVADDNSDMREYIARILGQHWTVEVVSDGMEALEAVARARPDLVLSDVMMPRLDGFGLVRALRNDPHTATLPIILLSARAGEESTAEGLRAGADDYLVKPFSASSLLVRIEAQLSAARLRETLRKNADAERERLALMVQESPAAICVLRGRALTVELANPLILNVWGHDRSIIGKPLMDVSPELREQGFEALLLGVLDTGVAYQGRETLVRFERDGAVHEYYFDFVYAPIRAPDGTPDGVFVDAYEVTDKVAARRNIEQLRQEAEVANRLKDEFLATMSHELRTPLNAILGWSSILRSEGYDKKSLERGLATIERNARAQARLIDDVLDVSRIINGKLPLDMRRVDLNAIVRAAVDVVRPAAEAKRVHLRYELSQSDPLELVADADRLQQVVWNLLSNAIKFTPSEGTVALSVESMGSIVQLVVSDTGMGIAPEHLPFIFERFRQVDSSTTRTYGGLGLGLAIVRHLVELHGGSVLAESTGVGLGATFRVKLPVRAIHEARAEAESELRVDAPSSGLEARALSLSGIKILVVDDDEDSRLFIQTALERAGATVLAVGSAQAALPLIEEGVHVLISDIGMPEEDGFSLVERVRALPPTRGGMTPAIALTAYARTEDAARALRAGYQRHLAKPADLNVVVRTVTSLIQGEPS